jgi:spore germination protein
VTWAVIFVTFFYTFVSVVCLSAFGEKSAVKAIWPLMVYIRNINLPGLFIERLDGIILSIWVITVFTTVVTGFYIVTYSFSKLLNTNEQKQYALPLLIIVYYLALQPSGLAQLYEWGDWGFKYVSTIFIYTIPILALIIASLRKLGVKKDEEF